ncbi:extensin family protein, partial [Aestuariivirga sp.]|uniref:extensin-like domain-containing protein n=1 Tax=Aestuariivirga sp. TaxID=2650926 RepID=UPI003593769F
SRDSAGKSPPANTPAPDWPSSSEGWPASEVRAARAECSALLKGLAVEYEPLEPIGKKGGCGAPAPISLTRVDGVKLNPAATVNCDLAASLHEWVTVTVQPAAKRRLKTQVTEVRAAASYVCRRRNNSSRGKLSEHGRANALDMSGFSFAKSDASMKVGGGGWGGGILKSIGLSKDGSFLDDIRKGACTPFTTVLGPGSDRYHGDHFHVDVLRRKGDYRICK